jgi:hypothetical protein
MHTLRDNSIVVGPPKTDAGRRTVAIPPHIVPNLEVHLAHYVGKNADDLVFTERHGGPLRLYTVERAWCKARQQVGLAQLRLHDLRHTGNTLAAATGASTKELMARMGHASPQAALIYQHATSDRDRAIADALSDMATGAPIYQIRQNRDLTRRPLGHAQVTPASGDCTKPPPQVPDQDFQEQSQPCRVRTTTWSSTAHGSGSAGVAAGDAPGGLEAQTGLSAAGRPGANPSGVP